MIIKYIELSDFRNYEDIHIDFSDRTNIFFGDNAQGKTNILEAVFLTGTTKSHKGSHDADIIRFGKEYGVIRALFEKNGVDHKIGIQLRKEKRKAISLNGSPVKKASDILGIANVVLFSPEDLSIIKSGPEKRRRFIDMTLCQIDKDYLFSLSSYNKIVNQRNKLLKSYDKRNDISDTLDIWDDQLIDYGKRIIERRSVFLNDLERSVNEIHKSISGSNDDLVIDYKKNVNEDDYKENLRARRDRDIIYKNTSTGPHRDDVEFRINGIDVKKYGSQGQQRTVALALKMSEVNIIKDTVGDPPILLLDDVLSELDLKRQQYLLENLGNIQTLITCTGLDEFVNNRFEINKCFKVTNGNIEEVKDE